jgi:hypothetical protein
MPFLKMVSLMLELDGQDVKKGGKTPSLHVLAV